MWCRWPSHGKVWIHQPHAGYGTTWGRPCGKNVPTTPRRTLGSGHPPLLKHPVLGTWALVVTAAGACHTPLRSPSLPGYSRDCSSSWRPLLSATWSRGRPIGLCLQNPMRFLIIIIIKKSELPWVLQNYWNYKPFHAIVVFMKGRCYSVSHQHFKKF